MLTGISTPDDPQHDKQGALAGGAVPQGQAAGGSRDEGSTKGRARWPRSAYGGTRHRRWQRAPARTCRAACQRAHQGQQSPSTGTAQAPDGRQSCCQPAGTATHLFHQRSEGAVGIADGRDAIPAISPKPDAAKGQRGARQGPSQGEAGAAPLWPFGLALQEAGTVQQRAAPAPSPWRSTAARPVERKGAIVDAKAASKTAALCSTRPRVAPNTRVGRPTAHHQGAVPPAAPDRVRQLAAIVKAHRAQKEAEQQEHEGT